MLKMSIVRPLEEQVNGHASTSAPPLPAVARPAAPVAKAPALPAYTPELAAEMAPMYARVQHVITPMEWPAYAPLIKAINELKKQRNAVILAHNYMTPEIFNCVGDFRRRQPAAGARKRRAPRPTSSSRPACTSWPRPPSCSAPTRPC